MPQRDTSSQLTLIGLLCAFALLVNATAGGSAAAHDAAKGALVLAALAGAYVLLQVDPAWPLSIGLAATIFSGHWADAGSPVPIDRVLIGLGLLSLFLRARGVRDIFGAKPSGIHWLLLAASAYALSSAVISGTITDKNSLFGLLDRYGFV
ncbi:MAG: putative inorganic carbon ((-)) transporter, partial [Solirubrobacterales bacterium]|nr:putative inorganic carbon ((-)) transporter [Solirubrobacterales bacterium]